MIYKTPKSQKESGRRVYYRRTLFHLFSVYFQFISAILYEFNICHINVILSP